MMGSISSHNAILYRADGASKAAGWIANSVDPDQTPRFAASDLYLHYFLRHVCSNT